MTTYQDENLKEELKKCKQLLEVYKLALKDMIIRPEFLEDLSYELAFNSLPLDQDEVDDKRIEGYQEKIINALNDLLIDHSYIFPFSKTLETYILDKKRYYPRAYLDKLKVLKQALHSIYLLNDEEFQNKLDKVNKEIKSGISEEEAMKKLPYPPTIINKVELVILDIYYLYVTRLLEDAISASLSQLELLPLTLRTALELVVNGIFYEYLLNPSFEKTIPPISWRKKDTVPEFNNSVKYKERLLKITKLSILFNPDKYGIRTPKFYDVVYWLDKWKAFTPIANAQVFLRKRYVNLSQTIHGYLDPLSINIIKSRVPKIYLQELTYILDCILVGVLNAIRNLRFNKIILFRDQPFWKELEEQAKKAELQCTVYRLQNFFN